MKKSANRSPHVVLFVEGDTDKVFFERLLGYYKAVSKTPLYSFEIKNLKGVTRYTSKVVGKLANEIMPNVRKHGKEVRAVCCSYDTDVFKITTMPIVDWKKVRKEIKSLGIKDFGLVPVEESIEDWFLDDIDGIYAYLKIAPVDNISGKSGNDKMMGLYRRTNKVYVKGTACVDLVEALDMAKIRNTRKEALKELEELLNFKH